MDQINCEDPNTLIEVDQINFEDPNTLIEEVETPCVSASQNLKRKVFQTSPNFNGPIASSSTNKEILSLLRILEERINKIQAIQDAMSNKLEGIENRLDMLEKNNTNIINPRSEEMAQNTLLRECKVLTKRMPKSLCRMTGEVDDETAIEVASSLPIATISGSIEVEEKLQQLEFEMSMKAHLFKIKSTSGSLDDVLRSLFTDEFSYLHNFDGGLGKRSLIELNIVNKTLFDVFQNEGRKKFNKGVMRYVDLSHNRHRQRQHLAVKKPKVNQNRKHKKKTEKSSERISCCETYENKIKIPKKTRKIFAKMSQHQQAQHTAGTKKKKGNNSRKRTDGAGVGAVEVDTAAKIDVIVGKADNDQKTCDKKPLDASMEQLQMKAKVTKKPNASRSAAGSNWNSALGVSTQEKAKGDAVKANKVSISSGDEGVDNASNTENSAPLGPQSKKARKRQNRKAAQINKYLAMDCEMVGVGFDGQDDMLARVSIVNKQGEVLLDKFVKPRQTVTDYRTSISGIRPRDIEHAEDFNKVQDEVLELLQGKILVGHGIRNDLAVLHIKHPFANIRDTSRYKPLCLLVSNGRTPSLKRLCQAILGLEIQTGEHNSVEDARAAMNIYNRLSSDWENYIGRQKHHHPHRRGGK